MMQASIQASSRRVAEREGAAGLARRERRAEARRTRHPAGKVARGHAGRACRTDVVPRHWDHAVALVSVVLLRAQSFSRLLLPVMVIRWACCKKRSRMVANDHRALPLRPHIKAAGAPREKKLGSRVPLERLPSQVTSRIAKPVASPLHIRGPASSSSGERPAPA
jgi:hypothetical protein